MIEIEILDQVMADAQLFFKEIEDLKYSIEQPSLEFSKARRNFDKVGNEILNIKLPDINKIHFQKLDKKEIYQMTKEIINELYGPISNDFNHFFSMMKINRTYDKFEGGICGDYDDKKRYKNYNEGYIYSLEESYCPILLTHEYTHFKFGSDCPPIGFNYNYNEFCSIFADHFAANQMNHKNKLDHLLQTEMIRLEALKQNYKEYNAMQNYYAELNKPNSQLHPVALAYKFSFYQSYQYIIGTIYSNRLFDIYLQIPNEILQKFRQVINHELQIPDLLNQYQISLKNPFTIQSFQKKIVKVNSNTQ